MQDSAQLIKTCCAPNTFIGVTATGSIPFYYYTLNNTGWTTTNVFSNLTPGKHQIIARDEFYCLSDTIDFEVIDKTIPHVDTQRISICQGKRKGDVA